MNRSEKLAYLAGVMDSDGYFKVVKDRPEWDPRYHTQIGLQQLWPGCAVTLFAETFDGKLMKPMIRPGHRPMARCELSELKTQSAIRRLLPYLLVKRDQALLLLEVGWMKDEYQGKLRACVDALEAIRQAILSLHDGSWEMRGRVLPLSGSFQGYGELGPSELGWRNNDILAYLAGVMDSDGNLRIEKKVGVRMISPFYRINIRASQVVPSRAIQLLARTFGGHIAIKGDGRPNHRDLETWSLHDKSAFTAIQALLPYLLVKKQEAYLLLDLRRLKAEGKKGLTYWPHRTRGEMAHTMPKRCYTSEQVAEFERVHRLVQALHSGRAIAHEDGFRLWTSEAGSPQAGP